MQSILSTDRAIPIWISDYVLMGYGTGAMMAVPAHDERDFEFAKHYHLPIVLSIDPDKSDEIARRSRRNIGGKTCWTGEGTAINSAQCDLSLNGLIHERGQRSSDQHGWKKNGSGKGAVNYKFRDWLFSRQRYWGEPFPILHFEDGTKRVLGDR